MPPRPTSKKCSICCSIAKSFINLREARGLRVFCGNEMVGDERDLARIEDVLGAFDLAHHADCDGGGELVGENEVDLGVDDLSRLDASDVCVARQDLLGECHAHDKSIIRRRRAGNLPCCSTNENSAFRRARSTPGRRPTRRPARARCRSIKRRRTSSARPSRRRNSLRCAATATSTAESATPRSPRSRNGWRASRAAWERSHSPAAWRRSSAWCSPLPRPAITSSARRTSTAEPSRS